MKKWLMALCAIFLHLSIGSIYAWSQIAKLIENQISDWTLSELTFTFSISMLCLGFTVAFFGKFVQKYGARVSGILSAVLFSIGLLISAVGIQLEQIWMLYLGYGMFGGVGVGIGYLAPISTLLKWFSKAKGLATGLAIMGFGFGATLQTYLMKHFLPSMGITNLAEILVVLAVLYAIVMITASMFLVPPKDYVEEKEEVKCESALSAKQTLRTKKFYVLWVMLFVNVMCGLSIISVATQLGTESIHISLSAAAALVMIMGVFNGLGRFFWGSTSDLLTRPYTYMMFFIIQIVAFLTLAETQSIIIFEIAIFLIVSCYGGGFALIPSFIIDIFGNKEPSTIHGYILTAWATSGLVGPMFVALLKDIMGHFVIALYILSSIAFIGFIASLVMIYLLSLEKRAKAVA